MLSVVISEISRWAIPALLFFIPLLGYLRGVKVYEVFVQGAEEGFSTAVRIIPFLVGMLVAIAVFRESGAMELLVRLINPVMRVVGAPPEVLPLAVMRPLSGGGALGIAAELISAYGPDSFIGRLASVMQGSTDTTFYVLTVYFGSVGVRRYRYALTLGLLADVSGLLASLLICNLLFR
ncbi:spore maturation protein [Calderihabitans maritimus]|uniref:Nucleoside recognition protein n=1 Tax=Calderihabitans maritimus TaxID=1246530 RepID=A0A1Z5HP12_9FIRM|nr:spore maturation protein [Calderihabitans maritimus]GAW91035.1 nucleoside recognition protein [Calderihabitans maritimus]